MKSLLSLTTLWLLTSPLSAQLDRTLDQLRNTSDLTRDAAEAASKLGAALSNKDGVKSTLDVEAARNRAMNARVSKAERDANQPPDARETELTRQGERSLSTAMGNVSPEAGILLAQSSKTGATSAPPKPEVIADAPPSLPTAVPPAAGNGSGPQPLKATSLENPETTGGTKVVITSTGAAFFDANKAIAIFSDNVEVRHPQFFVSCDEFEVHMIKEDAKAGGKKAPKPGDPVSAPPPPPPAPGSPPLEVATPENENGIKFAIARGRMVVIENLTETGDIQVGKCRHATYQGSTGDMLLRDFPQVQRGNTLQIATDPSTTMTIKQNGELRANGPSRTEIIRDVKTKKKSGLGSQPAPAASPNPSPQ